MNASNLIALVTAGIALVSAIAAIVSAKSSAANAKTAKEELQNAKVEAERMRKSDSLKIVLDIENQMNARKSEFDDANKEWYESLPDKGGESYSSVVENWVEAKKESYYNIIDRLCFCYLNNLVEEKEWRPEYRNLIHDTITSDPESFGADSPYRNIIDLDAKWQRQ